MKVEEWQLRMAIHGRDTAMRMMKITEICKLLEDAEKTYNSIPRWRIFKRRFANDCRLSTSLMVRDMLADMILEKKSNV